ncbi:MAG: hypothetical protein NUW22_12530 [Acidobacteria bacterium]|nr:hypothetical protein [Acidobacteriota bacterium]
MSRVSNIVAALGRGGPSPWPPPPRELLPPFPQPTGAQPGNPQAGCWTHDAFDPTLPFVRPGVDIDFHRANVMGLRKAGLPQVGGNTFDPSFIVTWFHYQYMLKGAGDQMLDALVAAGNTHIDLHRAAWMGRMTAEGAPACSREEALQSVRECAARIPFPIVNLAIDNGAPDPNELKLWIDDLIAAGMKIGCLAWQMDQRMSPIDCCDYINWAAPYLHARGCKVAVHWINEACAWWSDENEGYATGKRYDVWNRFDFQRWATGKIDYHYMQFDVNAAVLDVRPKQGGIIGAIQDVLGTLTTQKLVVAEYDMQAEFNDPSGRPELYGDLKGRCIQSATINGRTVSGYLNGARLEDGSVL